MSSKEPSMKCTIRDVIEAHAAMAKHGGLSLPPVIRPTLFLALILALMAGCTYQPRTMNAGASGPWKVTTSPVAVISHDFRGIVPDGLHVLGYCDHEGKEIRLPNDVQRDLLAAVSMHELGHQIAREYPRIWVILDAMDAPGFPCGSDDLHAAQRAAKQATKDNK